MNADDEFRKLMGYEPPKHRILGFLVVCYYKLKCGEKL